MKKIILILFLFISCYLIYINTEKKELTYVAIGDKIADINYNNQFKNYNNEYINKEYRIIDLINIIKYNVETNKKSIHQILKKSDILIVSIGMNDLYYKLNTNTINIYTYLNDMLNNIDKLFKEINKYNYKHIFILGYYNISTKYNDLFTYINYKAKKIAEKYKYEYIELNNVLKNSPNFYQNNNTFNLNNEGYQEINKIIVEKLKKS